MRRKFCAYILVIAMILANMGHTVFAAQVHETAAESSEAVYETAEGQLETVTQAKTDEESENETQAEEMSPISEEAPEEEIESEDKGELEEIETEIQDEGASAVAGERTSGQCGDNLTWTIDGETLIISGTGEMYDYQKFEEVPWYSDKSSLTKLVLEEGITKIGKCAFAGCSSLTGSLNIPGSVTVIGEYAFNECTGFTGNLIIPNGMVTIGHYAFYKCSGLTGNLKIPDSVTTIGAFAFNYCSGLTGNLEIPDSVTELGGYAFANCTGFTGNLRISNSITVLENGMFVGCSNLTGSLKIPDNVTLIGAMSFADCRGLTGTLTIPDSVTTIWESAFEGCSGFTGSIVIPNKVKEIEEYTFNGCSGLNGKMYIPGSVISIAENAFDISEKLTFYGAAGSYAEGFAQRRGITFIAYNVDGPVNSEFELAGDNCANIYVMDKKTQTPIEGASVMGVKTDADGCAKISLGEEVIINTNMYISITAEGYLPLKSCRDISAGGSYVFPLCPDTEEFEIVSVSAIIGDEETNLLDSKLYLEHTSNINNFGPITQMELKIEVTGASNPTYTLLQDGKKVRSIPMGFGDATNSTVTMQVPISLNGEENPLTEELDENAKFTVLVEDGDERTAKRIGIYVAQEKMKSTGTPVGGINILPEIAITPEEDTAFVGDETLKFGFNVDDSLSVTVEITEDRHVKMAVNKSADKTMKEFKEGYDRLKDKALNAIDQGVAFGGLPQSFGGGKVSIEGTIAGYGEGYLDDNGGVNLDVGFILSGKGSAKYTQYFFVLWVAPVYLSIEAGAEVTVEDFHLSIKNPDGMGEHWDIGTGLGKLTVAGFLTPKAGIGIEDWIDLSISGTGTLEYCHDFAPYDANDPNAPRDAVRLKGTIEISGNFAMFGDSWSPGEINILLLERLKDEGGEISLQSLYNDMTVPFYDSSAYTIMDRSYYDKTSIENYTLDGAAGENGSYIQTYAYPGADPKLVVVKDRFYLFWLQDISTRKSEDRAAVVYAISEDGVNFTAPKQLVPEKENQTLDNDLDVFTEGDKIYLCWQDAAENLPTGVSLEEMVQSFKISYAVIDGNTGNVLSHQTVTDEAGCYLQPKIYVKDGKVKVAWVKTVLSGQGGLWSADNNESLQIYDAESGQISELSIGGGKEKVVSLDGAVGESQAGVAYIMDVDGDMATTSDRKVYFDTRLGTAGSQSAVTAQEGQYSGLCAEGGSLYWYADGNISYTAIGSSAVVQIYEEEQTDLSSNFKVIAEESETEIIWNAIEPETQKAAIYGIKSLGNGCWSSPYVLEQTDSEMTGALSGSLHNGIPYVSYMNINDEADGSRCYSIYAGKTKDVTDIALNVAGYDYEQFMPGQILPIQAQVTNKGNTDVSSVDIKMDGVVIGTQEVDLRVGETKEITLNQYTVPEDIDNYALHTLAVSAATESELLDNDYQIGIGYTDLKVLCSERLFDGNTWLDISVLNYSPIPSGAVLNIRADRKDGEILYTEEIGTVGAKKGIFLTVNLQQYESSCCTYFVEIVSSVEDVIEGNNTELVYTGYGTGVQGGSLIAEPHMYIVSFQSNGGNDIEAVQAAEGSNAREPLMPTREGYRFKGWYLNGTLYNFDTPVVEDITLTAEWEEYTVLVAPGASIESDSTVKRGTKLSLTCAASGTQIYYTLDGTEPSMESTCFEEPIELVNDQIIKAFSVKAGYKRSETVTFVYKVTDSDGDPSKPGDDLDKPEDENTEGVFPEDIPADGKIPEGLWIAGVKDVFYTGKAIKPEVRVYDSDRRLKVGQDYTISYKNNTKVNDASKASAAPTIVVKGKGNYKGTETAVFKILPIELTDKNVITEDITVAYNKKVQKKVPIVTYNGKKLTKNKDFIVSYPTQVSKTADSYKAVGTYDIVLTAKEGGNFTGTRTVKLTITNSTLMSKTTVKKIPNQTYTGENIEPEPIVSFKGTPLVKDRDYTLNYKNQKEVGTATITLTGIGNYAGTKTVTYKITGTPLNKAVITGVENKTYNGEEQRQNINVILDGQTLREGSDYEVVYSKHKEVGKASITIKGINAYTGTIKKSFKILPYDLKLDAGNQIGGMEKEISVKYVKGGCKPEIELTFAGQKLKAGKDYTLSYQNNKQVTAIDTRKMPVITIKGKGNFKGTLTKDFVITRKALNDEKVPVKLTVADKVVVNKAGKYVSKPVLTDTDGKKLTAGKDYECVYALEDGTLLNSKSIVSNVGTKIKIKVTGKGAYSGELEDTYQITKKDFSKAKITISPKVYTGTAITLREDDITVRFGREELGFDTDYVIVEGSYINNEKKGTASVTIAGKGNYGGMKTVKFKITAKQFAWFWQIFK